MMIKSYIWPSILSVPLTGKVANPASIHYGIIKDEGKILVSCKKDQAEKNISILKTGIY